MIAWVTGGGTGIGRALAEKLSHEGHQVAISGRRAEVLEETARELSGKGGGQIMAVTGDISNPASVRAMHQHIMDRWGDVDLLINNAGANAHHSVAETPLEEYEEQFRINCLGAISCVQAVLPAMQKRNNGVVVNISSVLGKWASSNSASYSVSKYAMAGFTDALRQELVGTNIHVLGVYPGYVKTAMTAPFVEPGSTKERIGRSPEAMAHAILKALHRKKANLYYPWYVPWFLRAYRWFPGLMDQFARRVKRG